MRVEGGGSERESETDGRKSVRKKCLRPGHQKLFQGDDPPRSTPARKGPLSFSPFLHVPSPPSSPLIQVCLAKIRRLSLKVTRRNRRRVTRACKRVEGMEGGDREGRGKKGEREVRRWVVGRREPRDTDGVRAYTHPVSLGANTAGYRRKSPKGKYAKQRPSLPPSLRPSLPRLLCIVRACHIPPPCLFACTRAFSASLSLPSTISLPSSFPSPSSIFFLFLNFVYTYYFLFLAYIFIDCIF